MEKLKRVMSVFSTISTMVIFASAFYTTIFWRGEQLNAGILWQILAVSFLCSWIELIAPKRELEKKKYIIMHILSYIYVNIVVLVSGILFEWFFPDRLFMVIGMLVLIAVVYAAVFAVEYYRVKKLTDQLNRKLRERNEN